VPRSGRAEKLTRVDAGGNRRLERVRLEPARLGGGRLSIPWSRSTADPPYPMAQDPTTELGPDLAPLAGVTVEDIDSEPGRSPMASRTSTG
jgi:hypothetical protein